ncbi:MAG: hypothetical protein U5L09_07155 [Bacteroidales bacterium]|nr:hypothetical protein [Bacteroidales bacterium]
MDVLGSGTFTDSGIEEPEYMPSAEDINSGQVTLYLEAFTDAPCEGDFTDSLTVNIRKEVQLSAGANSSLCGPVRPCHYPQLCRKLRLAAVDDLGQRDVLGKNIRTPPSRLPLKMWKKGIIQLSLTGSNAVCFEVSDTMEVALYIIPLIYMAEDTTICSSEVVDFNSTEVDHYLTITWQTNGTGIL